MSTELRDKIGMKLDPITFKVESGKIAEFALAIGDMKDEYLKGEKLPPTFPAVIEFWGSPRSIKEQLGLKTENVLHGEQEYEYIREIKPGDLIAVESVVEDIYSKASMTFVVVKKEFFNEKGELVLRARINIIERH